MKIAVVYTMKGCPHCVHIKEELKKNKITFIERDIEEYEEEYDEFVKVVENEYVPALMLLTLDDKKPATFNKHDRVLIIDGLNLFLRNFAVINYVNQDGVHIGGLGGFLRSLGFLINQNTPTIKWINKVHERLDGFKTYAPLPAEDEFCLLHPKTIEKQEKQNQFYNTL